MDKHIFFDLDETLLHTRFSRDETGHAFNPIVKNFGDGSKNNPVFYTSYLRPGALALLKAVRALVPEDRIYALTSSTNDYARWNNEGHGFGFAPERIFAREALHGKETPDRVVKFDADSPRAYLIDNLPRQELGGKLSLLHRRLGFPIDQLYTYRISEYYGPAHLAEPPNPDFGALKDEEIADILAFIQGHSPQSDLIAGLPASTVTPWG